MKFLAIAEQWRDRANRWRIGKIPEHTFVLYLSPLVGLVAGLAAVLLKVLIHGAIEILTGGVNEDNYSILYLIYPTIGIFITYVLIKFVIKEDIGHGVSKILHAFSQRSGKIRTHNMYSSMVTSTITIGFGGSVGAEAPVVLTGAAIGSNLGRYFRLNYKSIMMLAGCGAAAAIGGIFNAPLAGLLFTIEVLMLDLTTLSLLPLLLSAATATTVSYFLLGDSYHFAFDLEDSFDISNTLWIIGLGVICGLVSLYFTRVVTWTERKFKTIDNNFVKVLIGGAILGTVVYVFPALWGEGYISINNILNGEGADVLNSSILLPLKEEPILFIVGLIVILLFKAIATALTTSAGGIGGIFAPSLFVGCFAGYIYTLILELTGTSLPVENFVLYGMAGVMAGVMHAPMTAIFLIAEISGSFTLFVPLMIVSAISSITVKITDQYSIYHYHLAERGELLTHDKDKTVLTLLKLKSVIETDLMPISDKAYLRELVGLISISKRNIFPVLTSDNKLRGVVLLENIRQIMFKENMYDETMVTELMIAPPAIVRQNDSMDSVMEKFKDSNAWNLPVVEDDGTYIGFISKSRIFNAYRSLLVDFSDQV